jgi:transcriptional regulator with XRE-family HTH domain
MGTSDSTATERVAQTVRDAMSAQNVSQLALSNATGIPRVTLIRRLSGRSPFTIAELAVVAEALGVQTSELVAAA